ncbi:hypothetical protein [Chitinophaga silvisoli]|uniref:Uncharacterized protein n=1 Tax=Chitinophaga silvisoli TaxID=2291814 RepID=A0A3E1NSU6_9BACT|nr:hypothetical protein [Chitinophaga silvisoli]RFM31019.1 hypothetical protein DXN04_31125 [Chitinophaga silvisoli]
MSTSFYNFDYYIEANEKRDAVIRAEYDKVLGRVSNILIIYSAISVSLISICKDLFTVPFNFWYFMAVVLFGVPFLVSFVYAIRFLFPIVIPVLVEPREYYAQLRLELEATYTNRPELSEAQKEEINHRIKTMYLEELEDAITNNTVLVCRKRDYYHNALKYAIYSIFPFIICLIFHLIH